MLKSRKFDQWNFVTRHCRRILRGPRCVCSPTLRKNPAAMAKPTAGGATQPHGAIAGAFKNPPESIVGTGKRGRDGRKVRDRNGVSRLSSDFIVTGRNARGGGGGARMKASAKDVSANRE